MDECKIEVAKTARGYTYTFQAVGLTKLAGFAQTREQVAANISRWIIKHFN